ncbi:MAG TPA: class I SAM-dependent methyltransferase [Candidatus Limnocylindrales bacterium]|nr:class I SAM-dependent methyltransferase [Candidatus Limnocylindrales bacterium]
MTAPPFYAQPGLQVAVYDAMSRDVPGGDDIGFFADLAAETGGPILELGCGTGRVALPLAAMGNAVVGLDLSAAMLRRAEAKRSALEPAVRDRLTFVEGDMTSTAAGDGFGLAFAAYRAFMMVLTPDDQLATLRSVRSQLRPDGLVAIDLFDPRFDLLVGHDEDAATVRGTYVNPETGRPVRATVMTRTVDLVAQTLSERWLFEELDELGHPSRSEIERLDLRWTFRHEMRHLLTLAGFEPVAEYSDFARSAPAYATEQIWVARVASR